MTIVDRLAAPFSAQAQLRVGLRLIESGKAGKGLRRLARAARRDCVEAQYRVGRCYLEGQAVPPSRFEAMRWLEQAARRGHAQAQLLVAALYAQGIGYDTDASRTIATLFADGANADPDFQAALSLGASCRRAGAGRGAGAARQYPDLRANGASGSKPGRILVPSLRWCRMPARFARARPGAAARGPQRREPARGGG